MRIGCCAYSYRQFLNNGTMTLERFLDAAVAMRVDGVELTSYYFRQSDRAALNEIKRECFKRGLHISGTAVGSNFCDADAGKRAEHVAMTKQWIDNAVILGAPCIRVFAGPVPAGHTEDEAVNWAVACLRECAEYGQQQGVVVALENHGGITARAEQVLRLVQEVNHPWLGVNLDFGNFREDPYREFAAVMPHVVTTHAKTHWNGPAGPERVDFSRALRLAHEAGFRGYVNIEYEGKSDPRVAVPEFAAELLAIARELG
ncbi:MAG: sugar phosphate isomerase/epimerase family protein [Armatimonadota bacterium]|jgi:sugar phosphate isomerase/epimerase|nr:sugar phosphate isomerase/epimerase family protein [Armatimonadota bacterium]